MTPSDTPVVTRVYQNHHLDSTRWEVYAPRAGDLIVTTSYKSGTTWMQEILMRLLRGAEDSPPSLHAISPWVDARFMGTSREELEPLLGGLPDTRFLKSHLPLDGLPWYPEVHYLIVGRDPRDVFMSFFNHYQSYTDIAYSLFNAPDAVGEPLQRCPEDPRELFRDWISRGWFEWESEGYPFWSNLHHSETYWKYRHLPNLHFFHYRDMLADLDAAVRRVAGIAGVDASEDHIAAVVEATTFANVKKRVEVIPEEEDMSRMVFEGGQRTFFHKGTNGRWRDVLTDDDLTLYEKAKERVLSPACARWLEEGGAVV